MSSLDVSWDIHSGNPPPTVTRCYDHNCRSSDKVTEKINYCHNNPVTRGLGSEPGQWRWSSYNWYMGQSDVPLEMDEFAQ